MKTILLIHDGTGPVRGSEKVIFDLFSGIESTRYGWHALTNHAEFAEGCRQRGISTDILPKRMQLFLGGFRLGDIRDLIRFAVMAIGIIRQHHVSLIHVNNGGAANWAVLAAWWCGIPLLVHLHAPSSRRKRFLLGFHLADRIVGVSHAVLAGSNTDPIAAKRLRVIYNGFGQLTATRRARNEARAPFGILPHQVVLGLTAVLIPGKLVDIAIEAMRQLRGTVAQRCVLLVIGDGPERTALEQRAKGLQVIFAGYRDDVHDVLLNVVDIFVLPSEMEAFSIALLEAAAAGVPRIGAAAGGTPESISDGIDGLIVPIRDPRALARAIEGLIADPDRAKALGDSGYQRLRSEFTPQRFLEAFAALYDEMTNSPAPRLTRITEAFRSVWSQLRRRSPRSDGGSPNQPGETALSSKS